MGAYRKRGTGIRTMSTSEMFPPLARSKNRQCSYCKLYCATGGGLARHYQQCPKRDAQLRAAEMRKGAEVCEGAAVADDGSSQNSAIADDLSQDFTPTQSAIASEAEMFDSFLSRLLGTIIINAESWTGGAETACVKLREIRKEAARSEDPHDRLIGEWLTSDTFERDCAEDEDVETVLQHAADRLNRIEDAGVAAIKAYMSKAEGDRFDEIVKAAPGLLGV